MIQLNELRPLHKPKKRKIVGKGGKTGRQAGRGMKGQKSRTGKKIRPQIRDVIKRIPKLRGYDHRYIKHREVVVLKFKELEKHFKAGEEVSKETLHKKGLLENARTAVKVLSDGELKTKLVFKGINFSEKAKEKATAAGATFE